MNRNTIHLSIAAVCGIAAGYFITRYLINKPNNKLAKVVSTAGQIIGITDPVKNNTSGQTINAAPSITNEEKQELFMTARGYLGGANPPKAILEQYRTNAAAAQARIDLLGLRAEYDKYLLSLQNEPPRP
jgi:hypothetical protein